MKQITLILLVVFFLTGCSANRVNTEFKFGNKLAKRGLWKEAYYRWTRALKAGDDSAAIHNNIAISLEYQNKLAEAEAEYQKALKLSPGNEYIKRNISRLKKRMNPDIESDFEEKKDLKKMKKKDKRRRK
ncbi:MAG: tetratricopeptide repeat protein [Candidatus Aminicenantes bacterium]|nr:tetratricopeptide repeat protein [Candidatus Aminicenantes bacterium]